MQLRQTTFPEFFKWVQEEVKREIDRRIKDENIRYALEGGKRLRPAMLLLSFKACNGSNENYYKALESAVGVELAHSASLIHDDIMDNDMIRRGRPALHVKVGIGPAILIGHKMINMAFQISLNHGMRDAQIFLDAWNDTLIGQLKDIDFTAHLEKIMRGESPEKLIREYFKIIEMKTASLFATACRAGAIEAEADEELIETMQEYGREVGIAYQLADDFVDLMEGKTEEGIILPIIKIYGSVDEELLKKLQEGNLLSEAIKKHIEGLKEIYKEEIRKHIERAKEIASLNVIPDSEYKELLKEAPHYIVNAMMENIGVTI